MTGILCFYTVMVVPVSWFLSNDVPEIPPDILARLDSSYDYGDIGDVEEVERERSSVRRLVAMQQQQSWRLVQLQTDLITSQTNVEYLKEQVRDLVRKLGSLGYSASHKPPS